MSFQEQAQIALKQSGGRLTEQRNLVIRLLANSRQQIDAESLYFLAHQEDASISLATVYRTLNALADAGVIHRRYLSPEHNRQYFERLPDEQVLHISCRECQKSIAMTTKLIADLKQEIYTHLNWEEVNVCSCLSGICDECYSKSIQSKISNMQLFGD